jgi:hypothetical protein
LRETLQLINSSDNSFIDLPLASSRVLSLEDARLKRESSFILSLINVDNFDDTIVLELSRDKLKMELDREKSYKV